MCVRDALGDLGRFRLDLVDDSEHGVGMAGVELDASRQHGLSVGAPFDPLGEIERSHSQPPAELRVGRALHERQMQPHHDAPALFDTTPHYARRRSITRCAARTSFVQQRIETEAVERESHRRAQPSTVVQQARTLRSRRSFAGTPDVTSGAPWTGEMIRIRGSFCTSVEPIDLASWKPHRRCHPPQ